MISSPDVIQLFAKMKTNEELTVIEDTLLEAVANRLLTHWYSVQTAHDRKLVDLIVYEIFCEDVERWMKEYPPMRKKFLEITSFYSMARDIPIYAPIFEQSPHGIAPSISGS